MMTYGNLTANGISTQYSLGPQTLLGGPNQYYNILWAPTWRSLTKFNNTVGGTADQATRTATTCFMRGLKETMGVETIGAAPWRWRRIIFTTKGLVSTIPQDSQFAYALQTNNNGYVRVVNNMPSAANSVVTTTLFKGVAGVDWALPIIAPVDTTRVNLLYDKTRTFNSGNDQGYVRNYKLWHSFNKNLVYNDDENGETQNGFPYSTLGKPGMGDVLIYDIFDCGLSGTTSDALQLNFNSTLYWHEK